MLVEVVQYRIKAYKDSWFKSKTSHLRKLCIYEAFVEGI